MANRKYNIASAGHGKTEQIASMILSDSSGLKTLVLTHTNAGVSSLIKRFKRKGISSDKYDIYTLDSFSVRYALAYPLRSGIDTHPAESDGEYDLCRKGAIEVFKIGFLQDFLQTRYSQIIVDEYQDCEILQHELVLQISENVDCTILGDPMQGIFNFGGATLVSWEEIRKSFDEDEVNLDVPYRWRGGNEDLGEWIRSVRDKLEAGEEIVFEGNGIEFVESPDRQTKYQTIMSCLNESDEVLVLIKDESSIGSGRKNVAQYYKGRLQIIDALEFKELNKFLRIVESDDQKIFFEGLLSFCSRCITQAKSLTSSIQNKIEKIWCSSPVSIAKLKDEEIRRKDLREKELINELYQVALDAVGSSGVERSEKVLLFMNLAEIYLKEKPNQKGYIFRWDVWKSAKNALSAFAEKSTEYSLLDCGRSIRQKISFIGRGFKKVVSTTLLTKGLEFDHVIIIKPEDFETKHLYVALSRAKKKITILGDKQVVQKERPQNL